MVRDATEDEREHERDVAKAASDSDLVKTALDGVLRRAPDLALLSGGYYLGAVMNMRPGLTIPLPIGNVFFGFPDFGGKIDELKDLLSGKENDLAALTKAEEEKLQNCQQSCFETRRAFEGTGRTFDQAQCVKDCLGENIPLEEFEQTVSELKADLRKHTIAQGILMATIVYAVTRAGFIAGVGEILPG